MSIKIWACAKLHSLFVSVVFRDGPSAHNSGMRGRSSFETFCKIYLVCVKQVSFTFNLVFVC